MKKRIPAFFLMMLLLTALFAAAFAEEEFTPDEFPNAEAMAIPEPLPAEADVPADKPEKQTAPVFPPEVMPEPDELLRIADDEYFPRIGFSQTFWETQGYVNEILDGRIIHQWYVRLGKGSDLLMSMFPAEVSVRTGNYRLHMDRGWMDNYHAAYTMQRAENLPEGAGRCWMRYSNILTKGSGMETGLLLIPGDQAYAFEPSGDRETLIYTPVADLSRLDQDEETVFDFIRIGSVSYIYANGRFLFTHDDGFRGRMSFEGGSEIFEGGNRVRCDFDNFKLRYR